MLFKEDTTQGDIALLINEAFGIGEKKSWAIAEAVEACHVTPLQKQNAELKQQLEGHTPTQWAYNKACDALREAKQQRDIAVEALENIENQRKWFGFTGEGDVLLICCDEAEQALKQIKGSA